MFSISYGCPPRGHDSAANTSAKRYWTLTKDQIFGFDKLKSKYSIRKLEIKEPALIAREVGDAHKSALEAIQALFQKYPFALKVKARGGSFEQPFLAALSSRGFRSLLLSPGTLILFSDAAALREWSQSRKCFAREEEEFIPELRVFLARLRKSHFEMSSDQYMFKFGGPTRIMGILNATPDSFFAGARFGDADRAVEHGFEMEKEGADILDIGGESTRPGAAPVSEADELSRVIPVVEGLAGEVKIPLSVDTYKAPVAEAAIQAGATIVNDVSGMQMDPHMLEVVAHYAVPVIIMHMKGEPQNMQINPVYDNLMDEIYEYFEERLERAETAGVDRSRVIVDPGIGFGKRLWDNYEILQRLPELQGLGCPILVGPSRKSFIGKILNLPAEQRLEGTAAAVTAAIAQGCHLVRVHDIKEMLRVVQIADLIFGNVTIQGQDSFE